jgi:hypothetical protein
MIEGISRKTFDGVDDPGGTNDDWPITSFFRAGWSTVPIAEAFEGPGATEPSRAASTRENDKRPITHIAKTITATCFFICKVVFP